jgi:hypothetical protein
MPNGLRSSLAVAVVSLSALLFVPTLSPAVERDPPQDIWAPGTSDQSRESRGGPNPSDTYNELRSVSASSAKNAWAVGFYAVDSETGATKTLILRWNGTIWSRIDGSDPSPVWNSLSDVSALSSTNAWAVGSFVDGATGMSEGLIMHWDGEGWSQVDAPDPSSSHSWLEGVSAISVTDVWAIGLYADNLAPDEYHPWILHWDGTSWSQVDGPEIPASDNFGILDLSASSTDDAWAVGYARPNREHTLVLHWDGTRWSRVRSPNPSSCCANILYGVSAISPANAWAVGDYFDVERDALDTLILHWDGTRWSKVTGPVTGRWLSGVSGRRRNNVWAVGGRGSQDSRPLVFHWDGSSWSMVEGPHSKNMSLADVAVGSASVAWTVGYFYNRDTQVLETLILHWDGTRWSRTA